MKKENYVICDYCGEFVPQANTTELDDGTVMCENCLNNEYYICANCGTAVWFNDAHENPEGKMVCDDCFEENYRACETCDDVLNNDDVYWFNGHGYCHACYQEARRLENRDVEFKDIFKYHCFDLDYDPIGYGRRHFGIELEIEDARYFNIVDKFKKYFPILHLESDSSLDSTGFEIISFPFTLDVWKANAPYLKELLDYLIRQGATSHDNEDCGLHIHVNRSSIKNVDKLIAITELFKDELQTLARRKANIYCNFHYNGCSDDDYCELGWCELCENIECKYNDGYTLWTDER